MASVGKLLKVLSNWMVLCHIEMLQKHLTSLAPFVHLAMEALEHQTDFTLAVDFVCELLRVMPNASDVPELTQLTDFIAAAVIKFLPQLQQDSLDDDKMTALARLICELGCALEDAMLAPSETSEALLDAILAVTSHPENDIHQHTFEFWER